MSDFESPTVESPFTAESTSSRPSAKRSRWWGSSSFKMYICHVASSWGDRMWNFAVGLYLVILHPDSLILAAVYGFSSCLFGIVLGPYLGRWIDQTQRITAARVCVVVQNSAVVIGATVLTFTLYFQPLIQTNCGCIGEYLLYGIIITFAIVAELLSSANKIVLEKDWIVVLAGGNNKKLSRLNSNMRTIDLATFILAPIVVGQIIHYGSREAGAIFIAVWNVISGLVEYTLLHHIYRNVPELSIKEGNSDGIPFVKINSPIESDHSDNNGNISNEFKMQSNFESTAMKILASSSPTVQENKSSEQKPFLSPGPGFEDISLKTPVSMRNFHVTPYSNQKNSLNLGNVDNVDGTRCLTFFDGWHRYLSHKVFFAGLGLSSLYMTVLGFDSITTGFIYSQGVNESWIGITTAFGATFGILGSLSFPFLRKKLGKNRTGLVGFCLETSALMLCVASVFVIGSPFKPESLMSRFDHFSGSPMSSYNTFPTYSLKELWDKELHVIILLFGIIIARFGLWIADLSVTQIFQEEVEESQRGIISGVQDSLNKFLDLVKFALVILLPSPETFGYLIITSWIFVFLGTVSFSIFAVKDKKLTTIH